MRGKEAAGTQRIVQNRYDIRILKTVRAVSASDSHRSVWRCWVWVGSTCARVLQQSAYPDGFVAGPIRSLRGFDLEGVFRGGAGAGAGTACLRCGGEATFVSGDPCFGASFVFLSAKAWPGWYCICTGLRARRANTHAASPMQQLRNPKRVDRARRPTPDIFLVWKQKSVAARLQGPSLRTCPSGRPRPPPRPSAHRPRL